MVTNRERFPELSARYENNSHFQNAVRLLRFNRRRDDRTARNARRQRGGNNRSLRIAPPVPPQVGNDVDDAPAVS
jgi:hypothetical protein